MHGLLWPATLGAVVHLVKIGRRMRCILYSIHTKTQFHLNFKLLLWKIKFQEREYKANETHKRTTNKHSELNPAL